MILRKTSTTRWLSLALLLAAGASTARAADEALPRDDGNVYGQFDNGIKYIIRHNANPPGRVAMYLHVKTGALNETDDQNGLAHFLEHMAFNGSTHFPPGKLLPLLGGLGMTFGADTNAHTNLWETVYKLNLPDTKPKNIDLACRIFGDYAGGLSLSDEEINSERKIILEEYRTGEGVRKRINTQTMRDVFAGTKLAKHDVIGDAEQIKTFPPETFRRYYDTWYRPENMTLIVVGDVKPEDVLPAAQKELGSVKARTPSTQPAKAGLTPTTRPQAFVYTDGEQVTGAVDLTNLGPAEPPITTYEQYRRQIIREIATGIVNRRYRNLIAAGKAPFRNASAGIDSFLNESTIAGAEASGEPQDWAASLNALIIEIDRAVEHGFSDDEMKLIERGMLSDAEQAVITESSRDSTDVINGIARSIGQDEPLLSAKQELALLKRAIANVTPTTLQRAFDDAFGTRNFDYTVSLPANKPGVTIPKPAEVLELADKAWAAKTEAPTSQQSVDSLLAAEPTPGTVTSKEVDADLGVATLNFANGVVMHHKFSDYKKDTVLVSIVLPGGQLEETAANRGISQLAGVIVDRPATGRFTSTQLNDLLTGKNVSLEGGLGRDSLTLELTASNKDLPTGLQLTYALLTDPNLEQAGVDDWKKKQLQQIDQLAKQPRGQLQKEIADTIYGGDPRFTPLTAQNVKSLQRDDAEAWFKRIAGSAAVEVTVVGDISLDAATDLISKYVGSLPKREKGFDALDALRVVKRPAGPYVVSRDFASVTPQAIAVGGFIGCDDNNLDRRPLTLAAEVLTNRMIDRIREKEQLVYSINAQNQAAHGLPGTGLFIAGSMTAPTNGQKLADTVVEMFTDFAKTGPTETELATAKRQLITEVTTAMREPGWWLTQISELNYRKRPLAELKNLPGVFDTFTKDDLQNVFAKYCTPDATVKLIATPKAAVATQPAAASKLPEAP